MSSKDELKKKEVFHKLFVPPCHDCGSTDVDIMDIRKVVIQNGTDFFRNIIQGKDGMASKNDSSRTYRCQKCNCRWGDEGWQLRFRPPNRRKKGTK